jgi:hypothetical protein
MYSSYGIKKRGRVLVLYGVLATTPSTLNYLEYAHVKVKEHFDANPHLIINKIGRNRIK